MSTTRTLMKSGQQRGFTLLEILIALSIGLFMIGALLTIVVSNRKAFVDQSGLAQLQDSERVGMTVLTDVVQSTGYFPDPTINSATGVFVTSASPAFSPGQVIQGTYSATPPGDTITIRYMTANNDSVLNCSGGTNTSGGNQMYVSTFSVTNGQLVCTMNTVAYQLVNGVTNLSILYGVNTSGSGNNVDTYLNANQMNVTPSNWNNVISVLATLTFTNPLAGQAGQPASFQITRLIGTMNQSGPSL